ncbi:MAG: hypothetical protein ABSE86_12750 [Bryobacteraceae bacterium]
MPGFSLITLGQRRRQLNPILDWHKIAAAGRMTERPFGIWQQHQPLTDSKLVFSG